MVLWGKPKGRGAGSVGCWLQAAQWNQAFQEAFQAYDARGDVSQSDSLVYQVFCRTAVHTRKQPSLSSH